MICTVTPNPSFDRTLTIDRLEVGEVHRAQESTNEAGGKGINVSRALARGGIANRCVMPAAESDEAQFRTLLRAETGLELDVVPIANSVRTNTTIVSAEGTTKINEAGPVLSPEEAESLRSRVVAAANDGRDLVFCGSLPQGVGDDFYAELTHLVRAVSPSTEVTIDTSGAGLRHAAAAGVTMIKPNNEELADLVGSPIATIGDAIAAAESVRSQGVARVLLSLGGDGALLVDGEDPLHAIPPKIEVRNTVGAGDTFLAGFLAAAGRGRVAQLVEAVAWGSTAAASPTTSASAADDTMRSAVTVGPADLSRSLDDT